MPLDPRIIDLVVRYEEAHEQGEPVTPEELCRDCPELLEELRRNLHGLIQVDRLVEAPQRQLDGPAEFQTLDIAAPASGTSRRPLPAVAGFELLDELGAGGMGVVYKARQLRLNRLVALKMILAGAHAAPAERERFRREAEMVARLHHPHIVHIYEFGEQDGIPYLVLEYVPGGSLAQYLQRTLQPPRDTAQFVETLARAVHVAHQNGIIHRDLKPANILLTFGRDGEADHSAAAPRLTDCIAKITDFGLAKRLDASLPQTRTGDLLGTPSYMAPEQAAGKNKLVGPTTDVHALGVILYELLTGRPPFRGDSHYEIVRHVLEDEAMPLSRLRISVPRDLEVVCLKCLEKAPARRYASALDLAEDLRRFQAGEPIRARRTSPWERAVKWVQRYPARALAALALVSVLAFFGAVWYTVQLRDAMNQLATAQAEIRLRERQHDYAQNVRTAGLFWRNGDLPEVRRLLERQRALAAGLPDLRGFEWGYLAHLCQGADATVLDRAEGPLQAAAFAPDGKLLATGGQGRTVRLWDTATWQARGTLSGHEADVHWVGFMDAQTLVTASLDRTVRLWDVRTEQERRRWPPFEAVPQLLTLSHDRRLLAAAFPDRTVRVRQLPDGIESPPFLPAHEATVALTFTPDNRHVATVSNRGLLMLFEASSGREVYSQHNWRTAGLAWSHTGRLAAHSGLDGRFALRTSTGEIQGDRFFSEAQADRAVHEYHGPLRLPVFAPDDRLLALAADDGTIRLEDVAGAAPGGVLRGHSERVTSLVFAPDGGTLVSTSHDGTVRRWDLTVRQECQPVVAESTPTGPLAFSPQGTILAVADRDRTVRLLEVATRRVQAVLRGHTGEVRGLAFAPDGHTLATACSDHLVRLWDVADGRLRATLCAHRASVEVVVFTADGKLLASGGQDGLVQWWDAATGQARKTLTAQAAVVTALAFSGDSSLLAATCAGNTTVRLWDVATGTERPGLTHQHPVHSVAFSRRGHTLAVGGNTTNDTTLWDAAAGRRLGVVAGGSLRWLAFSADDRYVYTSDSTIIRQFEVRSLRLQRPIGVHNRIVQVAFRAADQSLAVLNGSSVLKLINPADWSLRLPVVQTPAAVSALALAPDSKTLVTAGTQNDVTVRREFLFNIDRTLLWEVAEDVQLWDAATGRHLPPLTRAQTAAGFRVAAFAPDGRTVATGAEDGSVWLWDRQTGERRHTLPVGRDAEKLSRVGEVLASGEAFFAFGSLGANRRSGRIRALAFSPDGTLLAAASAHGLVKLFDPVSGRERATLPEEHDAVACLGFSPNGRLLAVNHRNEVWLWDVATLQRSRKLVGHREPVWALAFRPDGGMLATGGQDARIRLWDPTDGRVLAAPVGHQDTVAGLAFSPHDGGKTLASGGWDGKVKLWHVATGTELLALEAHTGRVHALAFAPDGTVLATGGETSSGSGEVFLWRASGW